MIAVGACHSAIISPTPVGERNLCFDSRHHHVVFALSETQDQMRLLKWAACAKPKSLLSFKFCQAKIIRARSEFFLLFLNTVIHPSTAIKQHPPLLPQFNFDICKDKQPHFNSHTVWLIQFLLTGRRSSCSMESEAPTTIGVSLCF